MPAPSRQQFLTTDKLRLLVERDPVGAELVNHVSNPNGGVDVGAYGWTTPSPSTTMLGTVSGGTSVLQFYTGAGAPAAFLSQPIYVPAGQWIAAQWTEFPGDNGHRARFAFFTSAGAQISATTASAYYKAASNTTRSYAAVQAPAGTSYARLRVDVYSNNSNADPITGTMRFTGAIISYATTAAALSTISTAVQTYWTDVLPSCSAITANRIALDVGTLTARIVSAALDPWSNTTLRPGRKIALEAYASGAWTRLFTGLTGRPKVEYPVNRGVRRPVITVEAYDAVSILGKTPAPAGWRDVAGLRATMESAIRPVPWNLNGDKDQVFASTGDATDVSATMLDQIIRTRDTNYGAAWVSRTGVLNLFDPSFMPTTTLDTLTEDDYNQDIRVAWDIERAINTITVTNLVGTTATTYGPFNQPGSLFRWGELRAAYTIVNHPDPNGAFATTVLQGNGTTITGASEPVLAAEALTVAMSDTTRVDRFAPRDLWDLIAVTCTGLFVNAPYRIRTINHTITAGAGPAGTQDQWLTTYGLAIPKRAPVPTI